MARAERCGGVMDVSKIPEKRAKWRAYFSGKYGGSPEQLDAAADAAMYVIVNGGTQDAAVSAGENALKFGLVQGVRAGHNFQPPTRVGPDSSPAPSGGQWPKNAGVVTLVDRRTESLDGDFFQVLNLRLSRLEQGRPTGTPTAVELRGRVIVGHITKGDVVEMPAGAAGRTVEVTSLKNLTTGATVEAKGRAFRQIRTAARTAKLILGIVSGIFAGAIILFALWFISGSWSTFP